MATERITIIVEEKGSRVVQRSLKDIGTAASGSYSAVGMLKSALLTLGAGAVLTNTVRTIANFEQALSTVKAVAGVTEAEFAKLRDTAADLGMKTRFTATQAAEGMVFLARAGMTAQQQMEAIDDTLRLAQAGALDLARASEITVVALRGFRLGTDQAGRVADVLSRAANMATTDVTQLADAMKFAGPIATGLKVPFEETVAALSTLSDAGLQASMAGTGLRRIMSELESPSKKTTQVLRDLGLTAKDVKISEVGLTNALITLRDAGMDTGQALEVFGDRGGPAYEVLGDMIPRVQQLNEAFKNSKGNALRVATIMDDNLNGALFRAKSAFEAIQLAIGQLGGSSLLTKMINTLAEAMRYLAKHVEIVEGAIAGLAFTHIPMMVGAMVKLIAYFGTSGIAIGAAIGLLVSYSDKLRMTADSQATLADFGNAAWERIKLGAGVAIEAISERLGFLSNVFGETGVTLQGFIRFTAQLLDAWVGMFRGALLAVHALFKNLGPALKDLVITWINDLLNIMDAGFRKFYELLGNIPGRVGEPYRNLAENGVIPRLENVAEGASEKLGSAVVKGFTDGLSQITIFEDSVNELFDRTDEIAAERLQKLQSQGTSSPLAPLPGAGVAPSPESSSQAMNQFASGIDSGMSQIAETITKYGSQVENTLVNAFNSAEDALVSFVTTGKVDFKGLVDSMLADLTRLISRMMMAKLLGALGSMAAGAAGGAGDTSGMGAMSHYGTAFGAAALGSDVTAGNPVWVGERGRELFVPDQDGRVVSHDRSEAMSQPAQVNIIQVTSMEEALAAMRSTEGQKIIVGTKGKSRL